MYGPDNLRYDGLGDANFSLMSDVGVTPLRSLSPQVPIQAYMVNHRPIQQSSQGPFCPIMGHPVLIEDLPLKGYIHMGQVAHQAGGDARGVYITAAQWSDVIYLVQKCPEGFVMAQTRLNFRKSIILRDTVTL